MKINIHSKISYITIIVLFLAVFIALPKSVDAQYYDYGGSYGYDQGYQDYSNYSYNYDNYNYNIGYQNYGNYGNISYGCNYGCGSNYYGNYNSYQYVVSYSRPTYAYTN